MGKFIQDNLKLILIIILALTVLVKEVNTMLQFIQNNPVLFAVIVIIIIALIVYAIKYRKDILKKAALYAVARAEEAWGSNTGRIKFAEAYTYIKKNYPFVTFFVSEDQLSKIIEDALNSLKDIIATKEGITKKEEQENLEQKENGGTE